MTIAAGLLCKESLIICADTLVSTATVGGYQSKIACYRLIGADVVFSLSGNVELAESAFQQCEQSLRNAQGKGLNQQEIANILRPILAQEYKTHVVDTGWHPEHNYNLIVAIRAGNGMGLYRTYCAALKRTKDGLECIGAGDDLFRVLVQPSFRRNQPSERAWQLVCAALLRVKRAMPGVVGGIPLVMNLAADGAIRFATTRDFVTAEKYIPFIDDHFERLTSAFLDHSASDEDFSKAVDSFAQQIRYLRSQWEHEHRFTWSNPPPTAREAIIDLR